MKKVEIDAFLSLFINNGSVLDFSDRSFNSFTTESIGIPLKEKYNLPKGASLRQYAKEAEDDSLHKLFSDLLQYYELYILPLEKNEIKKNIYEKCKLIIAERKTDHYFLLNELENIEVNYIKKEIGRAIKDLCSEDYDSAISKARTIMEEVLCFAIEKKGSEPSNKGDLKILFKDFRSLYKMNTDPGLDKRIKTLLSGLNKIVDGISEMRNEYSDSHGLGKKRINIDKHTAVLAVNSSLVVSNYIAYIAKNR